MTPKAFLTEAVKVLDKFEARKGEDTRKQAYDAVDLLMRLLPKGIWHLDADTRAKRAFA